MWFCCWFMNFLTMKLLSSNVNWAFVDIKPVTTFVHGWCWVSEKTLKFVEHQRNSPKLTCGLLCFMLVWLVYFLLAVITINRCVYQEIWNPQQKDNDEWLCLSRWSANSSELCLFFVNEKFSQKAWLKRFFVLNYSFLFMRLY